MNDPLLINSFLDIPSDFPPTLNKVFNFCFLNLISYLYRYIYWSHVNISFQQLSLTLLCKPIYPLLSKNYASKIATVNIWQAFIRKHTNRCEKMYFTLYTFHRCVFPTNLLLSNMTFLHKNRLNKSLCMVSKTVFAAIHKGEQNWRRTQKQVWRLGIKFQSISLVILL